MLALIKRKSYNAFHKSFIFSGELRAIVQLLQAAKCREMI